MFHAKGIFVHTAGPNTALVKSSGRKDVRIVIGGRMWAIPILQRVDYLSLALRTITVHTTAGLTIKGVPVDVTSACQVKIQGWSSDDDASAQVDKKAASAIVSHDLHMDFSAIRLAAQHFIGKSDSQIEDAIQKTIAGHQRAIIGCLTVEELYRDREAFCKRVLDLVSSDMRNMGLTVVSYTVADITDVNGYIDSLGVAQRERVDRDASEGRALHQAEAEKQRAKENAAAHLEVNDQHRRKIESDRVLKITDLKAKEEIERRTAIQKKAHSISSAEQDKILFVTQQKAKAADTEAQLAVVKQEVERERLMKEKVVHVEADALLYKAKVNADGVRATARAEAERVRMIGEAQAEAIRAKGLAEVEVLRERNRAWQESYVLQETHVMLKSVRVLRLGTNDENLFTNPYCILMFCTGRRRHTGRIPAQFWRRLFRYCRNWQKRFQLRCKRRRRWCLSAAVAVAVARRNSQMR